MIAAKDGSEAAVFAVVDALSGAHGIASTNSRPRLVLQGLDPAAQYTDEENNTYAGIQLLTTGLELPGAYGQTPAKIWYLKKSEKSLPPRERLAPLRGEMSHQRQRGEQVD